MNNNERLHRVVTQGSSMWECVICLVNDYKTGEIEHLKGCEEVFHYVQGVRNGVGFQVPVHRETQYVGPHSSYADGGQGFPTAYETGQGE